MSVESQVQRHRREIFVGADGVTTITFRIEGCLDQPLVVAALPKPLPRFDADRFARDGSRHELNVSAQEGDEQVLFVLIPNPRFRGKRTWKWRLRLPNAALFTLRDIVVSGEERERAGWSECLGFCGLLPSATCELVHSIEFESDKTVLVDCPAHAVVETHSAAQARVRQGSVDVVPGAAVEENNGAFVARFADPEVGRSYGIQFTLTELMESRAFKSAQHKWEDALRWIETACSVRSNHSHSAVKLHRKLTREAHKQLHEQLPTYDDRAEPSWTSQGYLWDAATHALQPIFGRFAPESWSRRCRYGEDAVGHAFRFDSEATYDGQHNRTLIALDSGYQWTVCVPLRYFDVCVGVVALAGSKRPTDALGKALRDLAQSRAAARSVTERHAPSCGCIGCRQRRTLGSLTWRMNCAFWGVLATSQFLSDEERNAAHRVLSFFKAQTAEPVQRTQELPLSRRPAKYVSDFVARAKPRVQGRAQSARFLRHWRWILASLVVPLSVAAIGGGPKWIEQLRGTETRINAVQTQTITADGVIALLRGGKQGIDALRRLRDDRVEIPSLRGKQLDHIDLHDAPLYELDLREVNFDGTTLERAQLQRARLEGANLQHARLDNADLQNAVLDGADLEYAELDDARMQQARARGCHLRHAHLARANVSDVDFEGADVSDANLQGAYGLQHQQLQRACADVAPVLPDGVAQPAACRAAQLDSP